MSGEQSERTRGDWRGEALHELSRQAPSLTVLVLLVAAFLWFMDRTTLRQSAAAARSDAVISANTDALRDLRDEWLEIDPCRCQ